MSLPNPHAQLQEFFLSTTTNSLASTPLACSVRAPKRCKITMISAVSHGIFTTDCSVAMAIIPSVAGGTAPGAGTAITGSPLVITAANSALGTSSSMVPSGANIANEGDLITFTPSGSTGTTIGGTFCICLMPA
jgi:hypothetical protein